MANLAQRLLKILDGFSHQRVLVAGDLIADEFLYGEISRVSREAPVLVINYHDLVRLPGGAANAANNLLALGCSVKVIGIVGRDPAGREMIAALSRKGADTSLIEKPREYATPVKTRILAGAHHSAPQQVVRMDRVPAAPKVIRMRKDILRTAARNVDGVILSDYGYGTVSSEITDTLRQEAIRRSIPIVVDSRFRMADFHNVTSMTPNITELEAAMGIYIGSDGNLLRRIGQNILRKQKLRSLLVTQGRFGMTLFQQRKRCVHIPIFGSDEVADVTGAGDTVIAVFTLGLACGAAAEDAARLANYAGGIVVMKRGTATVTSDEIRNAINQDLTL